MKSLLIRELSMLSAAPAHRALADDQLDRVAQDGVPQGQVYARIAGPIYRLRLKVD